MVLHAHYSLLNVILYAIVPSRNKTTPEIARYIISGVTASNGRFFVMMSFMASTSFVNGRALPKAWAASGIMSSGKKAPIKNWSGTLIITAIELAASSFFDRH